jgi:thioredoxin-related protein
MSTRRNLLKSMALMSGSLATSLYPLQSLAAQRYAPIKTEDGMYKQPWFLETFLELSDDHAEASQAGKRFVVMWEQKGCPYCKEMHEVNFARPEIHEYIRDHFAVLQLNLWGSRAVVDFDGETLEERKLARKWRVNFTPTIQFLPAQLPATGKEPGGDLEVARMPGYFKPFHFISMFEFVYDKAYQKENFQRYLQDKFAVLKAKGIDPNVW